MAVPESGQQFLIRYYGGIIFYPNRLAIITDIAVSGIVSGASGIAHRGADNSLYAPKLGFGAPESAQSEIGGFQRTVSDPVQ